MGERVWLTLRVGVGFYVWSVERRGIGRRVRFGRMIKSYVVAWGV